LVQVQHGKLGLGSILVHSKLELELDSILELVWHNKLELGSSLAPVHNCDRRDGHEQNYCQQRC
jgi:hypothetical protein